MPRVIKVQPLPQHRLLVEFDDGFAGTVRVIDQLADSALEPLRDEALFRQVTIDDFGAVRWVTGASLAADAIYDLVTGKPNLAAKP